MRHLSLLTVALSLAFPASAFAQWSSNPAANTAIADFAGDQAVPKIAASGDGSTWMMWFDQRGGSYAVYAQRLDAQGVETFAHGGIVVSNNPQSSSLQDWDLISDGAGGCVVAFTDTRSGPDLDVYAYRLDVNGNQLWGANGVTLSADADGESNPTIALTTDGYFVFAWAHTPSPGPGDIRIQKLDGNGVPQYPGVGITITGPGTEKPAFSAIAASDSGSYIVAYVRDITSFSSPRHIRAQKFDAAGTPLWNAGSPVLVYDQNAIPIAHQPQLRSDGNGGAVITWHRAVGSDFNAMIQRVDNNGNEVFPHNGISICSDTTIELDPASAQLANGDTIVFFDKRNAAQTNWSLSAQRISPAGGLLWGPLGIDLIPIDAVQKSILKSVPFGDGAIVCCFRASGPTTADLIAFRVDGAGNSVWGPSPLVASSVVSSKLRVALATDATGVSRMIWGDGRNALTGTDMYAQNINPDGTLGNSPGTCGTTPYCVGAPNSAGPGAILTATGSTCFGLNNLGLSCTGLPPNTVGLFYYGANAIQVPFGNGFRCVAGGVFRLGPAVAGNAGGVATRAVDLTQPPASIGPGAITIGSTWRFQFWYRDVPAGGAFFNLSNAFAAVFCL